MLSAILIWVLSGAVQAASFNCAKAAAADEKAVCKNCALAQKDVKMATLYEVVTNLVAMGHAAIFNSQRAFLKTGAACGASSSCIGEAYDARIATLEVALKAMGIIYDGAQIPLDCLNQF